MNLSTLLLRRRMMMQMQVVGDYIQDGLVFWLDKTIGKTENTWQELISGKYFTLNGDNWECENSTFDFNYSTHHLELNIPYIRDNVEYANFGIIGSFALYGDGGPVITLTSGKGICFYPNLPIILMNNDKEYYSVNTNQIYQRGQLTSYTPRIANRHTCPTSLMSYIRNNTNLFSYMRIYNRVLSADEVLYNYNIDRMRFG